MGRPKLRPDGSQVPRKPYDLHLEDVVALLPTPTVSDTNGPGTHGDGGPDLRTAVTLLPTPRATDGTKGGPNQRGSSGDLMLPSAVTQLLPTPTAHEPGGTAEQYRERWRRSDGREATFLPLTMVIELLAAQTETED